jgi:thioredoxin-related protein
MDRAVIIALLVIFLVFFLLKPEEKQETENISSQKIENLKNPNNRKVLKYFGAHYCPYSNKKSESYNIIVNQFGRQYPNVKLEVHWIDTAKGQPESQRAGVEYVPTLTDKNYRHIPVQTSNTQQGQRRIFQEMYNKL